MKTRISDGIRKNSGRGRGGAARGKIAPVFGKGLREQKQSSADNLIAKLHNYIKAINNTGIKRFPRAGIDQMWRKRFVAMRAKMLSRIAVYAQTQETPMKQTSAVTSKAAQKTERKPRAASAPHKINGVKAPKAIAKVADLNGRISAKPVAAKAPPPVKPAAKSPVKIASKSMSKVAPKLAAQSEAKPALKKSAKAASSKFDNSMKAASSAPALKMAKAPAPAKSSGKSAEKKATKSATKSVTSSPKLMRKEGATAPVKAGKPGKSATMTGKANGSAKPGNKAPAKAAAAKAPAKTRVAVAKKPAPKQGRAAAARK